MMRSAGWKINEGILDLLGEDGFLYVIRYCGPDDDEVGCLRRFKNRYVAHGR
jgi:hypothetical protein